MFFLDSVSNLWILTFLLFLGINLTNIIFWISSNRWTNISALICQCLASLCRSQTIVDENINEFSQKSRNIQSELSIEHSYNITIITDDFKKKYQEFIELAQTKKYYCDINNEINEMHSLENEKTQLEKELLEQTILLENISTILGKIIIS